MKITILNFCPQNDNDSQLQDNLTVYDCGRYEIVKENNGNCQWGMEGIYHGNDKKLSLNQGPGHTILCHVNKENFTVTSYLVKCSQRKVGRILNSRWV